MRYLIVCTFLLFAHLLPAQEKVCIPNVWSPDVVKGKIYLNSGDSLEGKFTHLTPYNDINTTHIVYKTTKGEMGEINRSEIAAYYNKKEDKKRLKVYIDKEKVKEKKGCFFDQGKFLEILRSGHYTLLKDELNYQSSIESYTQSLANEVYYIRLEDGSVIKLVLSSLRSQMISICDPEQLAAYDLPKGNFTIDDAIDLIDYLNTF